MWLLLIALAGCDDTRFNQGPVTEAETYSSDWDGMQALFLDECLACHSSTGASGELDLETDACAALVGVPGNHPAYGGAALVEPGEHESSILWHKLSNTGQYGGVMPPGAGLGPATVDSVAGWIDAGASCEGEPVDTGETGLVDAPTAAEVQAEVIDRRCVACHGAEAPDAGLDLTDLSATVNAASSYTDVLVIPGDAEGSFLYQKLRGTQGGDQGERMPPGGALPTPELVLVYEWIEGGAR